MHFRQCTKIIILALPVSLPVSGDKPRLFLPATAPPSGFEALAAEQRSLVDVYFGGRYITSQMATFRPGFIELSNPAEVVQRIGDITIPEQVINRLTGALNSNASEVCLPGTRPSSSDNCGVLVPPVAGVIFDEGRFRVDVFINRRFMATRAAEVRKYLPPSDAGFALMQNFSGAISGTSSSESDDSYTITGSTMAAWKENSLQLDWDYSNTNHFSVDQLYGQRDFEGREYSVGLLNTSGFGFNFTSDQPMVGARINSSTATRKDQAFTSSAQLEVFLPTRGRVEIFRDGRLLDSAFFEAGAQQLDTSTLPSGAYDIEIRVVDEGGSLISTETRFFAKQSQLPPVDEWLFFAESGRLVTRQSDSALPDSTDQWLSRAGVNRRLFDTLAATGSAAMDNSDALVELGLYHFGSAYEISQSAMLTDDGSAGIALNGRLRLGDLALSGNYRRLSRPDNFTLDDVDNPTMLGNGFRQHSASLSYPLFDGNLSYRYSLNQNDNNDNEAGVATRTHSVNYRRQLFRTRDYDGDITLSFSKSGDTRIALVSFVLRYRDDSWDLQFTPQAQVTKTDDSRDRTERARLSASWDDNELLAADLQLDGGIETGTGDERIDGSLRYANRYGRANFSAAHTQGSQDSTTSWAGSMSSSFLTDGEVFAVGGEDSADSAIVINLDGREGDVFDVKINDQRRGYAVAGTPSIVSLPPFEQYRVTLSPAGTTLYSFDEREKQVTLYPGNVVTLDYQAIPLQLLFGRLLFNGEPVKSASLVGGSYPGSTDAMGMFQLESKADIKTIQVDMENDWVCQLSIPEVDDSYIVQMGTVELSSDQCLAKQQQISSLQ